MWEAAGEDTCPSCSLGAPLRVHLPAPRPASPLVRVWSWEDVPAVAAALLPAPGGRIALFDDPGDLALAVLGRGAQAVLLHADGPTLALAELKWAAAMVFPAENLRSLLGLDGLGRRLFLYHYLRDGIVEGRGPPPPPLSEATRSFWGSHEALLRQGLAEAGRQEQHAARLRRCLRRVGLPAGQSGGGRRLRACAALAGRGEPPEAARDLPLRLLAVPEAPLARWVLTGAADALVAAMPGLSEAGRRAAAEHRVRPTPARSDDPPVHGLYLGARTSELDRAASRLAHGGRLIVRCEEAPAVAGLKLDPEASRALQQADRSLLGPPAWLLRAEPQRA